MKIFHRQYKSFVPTVCYAQFSRPFARSSSKEYFGYYFCIFNTVFKAQINYKNTTQNRITQHACVRTFLARADISLVTQYYLHEPKRAVLF